VRSAWIVLLTGAALVLLGVSLLIIRWKRTRKSGRHPGAHYKHPPSTRSYLQMAELAIALLTLLIGIPSCLLASIELRQEDSPADATDLPPARILQPSDGQQVSDNKVEVSGTAPPRAESNTVLRVVVETEGGDWFPYSQVVPRGPAGSWNGGIVGLGKDRITREQTFRVLLVEFSPQAEEAIRAAWADAEAFNLQGMARPSDAVELAAVTISRTASPATRP
jgi:hypothetical protein